MAWTISTAHNEARLNGTLAYLDTGSAHAKLRIYNGTRPSNGGTPTTLLCEIELDDPAGSVASGVLTLNSADVPLCAASGVATWARLINGNGDFVADGDVSTVADGTGQIQLEDTSLLAGGKLQLISASLT